MITENDVRLIRQRLIAIEEQRTGDATLIGAYLVTKRQLALRDVARSDVSSTWLEYWGVPGSVGRMTVLLDHGHEPVFRIPATLDAPGVAPVGSMEIPFYTPDELDGSLRLSDGPIEVSVAQTPQRKSWLQRFLYG